MGDLIRLNSGELSEENAVEGMPVAVVPIDDLRSADSPRLAGEDEEHVKRLAAIDGQLPPILVHRTTMRVIDGMHRLRAAILRGAREIAVRFYDGDPATAFVHAVEANVTHGLPLSQADREAAAARIITSHPHWSDRVIAASTGVAAKTVASIRRRAGGDAAHPSPRMGKDGRFRPLTTAEGRRKAAELFATHPGTTLRQVAGAAGISVGTARDVRDRVRRGEDPLPERVREQVDRPVEALVAQRVPSGLAPVREEDLSRVLDGLRRDPALRLTETGRALLRLLTVQAVSQGEWQALIRSTPEHCLPAAAKLARGCAATWARLATEFEERAQASA